ncbi:MULTISPECIES: his operon leader peptide [Enterobacterales]|nr:MULTISPECIES: his operon leader peptide [Enterobacterales]
MNCVQFSHHHHHHPD